MPNPAAFAAALLVALPPAASAQGPVPCAEHWAGGLAGLTEPLEETTRAYAEGRVRVLVVAADEPACCGVFAAVLLPDPEAGSRACRLLGPEGDGAFGAFRFGPGEARYDPRSGLVVPMTARVWDGEAAYAERRVEVVVNQATGEAALR